MACCIAWWCFDQPTEESIPLAVCAPAYVVSPDPGRLALFRAACRAHIVDPCRESRGRMDCHIREACLAEQPPGQYVAIRPGHHGALAEYVDTLAEGALPHHVIRSYLQQ